MRNQPQEPVPALKPRSSFWGRSRVCCAINKIAFPRKFREINRDAQLEAAFSQFRAFGEVDDPEAMPDYNTNSPRPSTTSRFVTSVRLRAFSVPLRITSST